MIRFALCYTILNAHIAFVEPKVTLWYSKHAILSCCPSNRVPNMLLPFFIPFSTCPRPTHRCPPRCSSRLKSYPRSGHLRYLQTRPASHSRSLSELKRLLSNCVFHGCAFFDSSCCCTSMLATAINYLSKSKGLFISSTQLMPRSRARRCQQCFRLLEASGSACPGIRQVGEFDPRGLVMRISTSST